MSKIQQLPPELIAKIAAGEVIERPSYAVKELIENAIDAHANIIEITIEDAGLKNITINDNGVGMTKEDLLLCFLPHTTSKIQSDHSLIGITSLGFRGEALSSIAAISQLSIQSRIAEETSGTKIVINEGLLEKVEPVGTPIGTRVTVNNLFHSVPARKKFLKSHQTELRHITEIVMNFSLSYPAIHFLLRNNKKTVLDLPIRESIEERIEYLFGTSFLHKLIPISYEEEYVTAKGYIGHPQIASKLNQKQFLFINNRLVSDKIISLAAKEAFGTLLSAANTPVFILSLVIPPEMVDVNVHPRKEQVSFTDQKRIFTAVKQAISESLQENNITFKLAKFKFENSAKMGETTSYVGTLLKEKVLSPEKSELENTISNAPYIQINKTYIVSLKKSGIILIDQHAAHERILFEQFSNAFIEQKNKNESYTLTKPIHLQLSVSDSQIIEEYHEQLSRVGFEIETFSGNSYIVREVPSIFKGRNIEKILQEIIDDLRTSDDIKNIDMRSTRMLSFLACRAAIKAGDVLSENTMKNLLHELDNSTNNATCPHGRPTKIDLSLDEINFAFKRK